ncbi:MAG: oligosaccharide flippase family protein [Solirubrobacterales bacterium]|nr:oligosaccharide flippase family protein [Solirubrobacterales bacterium]
MPEPTLKEATITGVRWVVLARVISEVLAFAGVVVLARLVPPDAFGRAAVALILVPLATILTFEGFAAALVQRASLHERHRETAMCTSLVAGALLSALTWLLARPVCGPLFGSSTAALVELVSPVFVLASAGAVSRASLWRVLDFRRTGVVDVAALFAGTATAVGLAVGGLDAAAIVGGALTQTAVCSGLLVILARPPRPRWHAREQREITAFGLPASFAGLVGVLFTNVDYAIVAARAGALQAGLYWRGWQLGVGYQEKISRVMMQLAFPVYSRTTDAAQLRAMHERATRVHAVVVFPLLAMLAVSAPVLVPTVFGPAWTPAVGPAQILCLAGMIAAILTGYPQVMLAIGRPRALLTFNATVVVLYAILVTVSISSGLIVLSFAVVGAYVCVLFGAYLVLLGPHAGMTLRGLAREIAPAVAGCVALVVVCAPLSHLLQRAGAPALVTLAMLGTSGACAYIATVRALFRPVYLDVLGLAAHVLPQRLVSRPRPLRRVGRAVRSRA